MASLENPIRDLFPGFYRPTEEEFKRMWDEGIVSVDANILLHAYRYSPPLRDMLFAILEKLGGQLWISHRVAYEFSKNRLKVISSQEKAYDDACAVLDKVAGIIKSELPTRHSVIDIEEIKRAFGTLVQQKKAALKGQKERHPKVPDEDPVLERLCSLLAGKIGAPYPPEREQRIPEEGEKRYKAKIPPGFSDASKKDKDDPLQPYGDYIVWRQLLDHVLTVKAPYFIFATDDNKEDWWWEQEGKTIGPHPALIHEAKREADCRAYLYRGDQFIKYGAQHFGIRADEKLIDEAEKVRVELSPHIVPSAVVHPLEVPYKVIERTLNELWQLEDRSELPHLARAIREAQYASSEFTSMLDAALTEKYKLPPSFDILERAQEKRFRRTSAASRAQQGREPRLEKLLELLGIAGIRVKKLLEEEKR